MMHIKGTSGYRFLIFGIVCAFGLILAYSPARADETPPPGDGELQEYVPDTSVLESVDPSPAGVPVCNPDIPDMIGYWPLDDQDPGGATITFKNYMGTSDGVCTKPGCPTKITGKVVGAYNFLPFGSVYDIPPDAPDTISVPKFADLDFANGESFSFETWVNIPPDKNCSGNRVFVGRRGQGVFSIWLGCVNGTNKARFSVRDNTGQDASTFTVDSTTVLNNGQWHHVVGVRDAVANKLFMYVDGALQGSTNTVYTEAFSGGQGLTIGWFNTGFDPFYYLHGSLDEVAVYNRALTLANVQSHYNGGNGKSYCNAGPVIGDPGDQSDREGDSISLQLDGSDQDPGTLNYSATGLPAFLTINNSGLISGRIGCDASTGSPYNVTVTIKNLATNRTGSTNFAWAVENNPNCNPRFENFLPAVLQEQ